MSLNHEKLSARRWARVRREVFWRDGYRCTTCGKPGRLEAHHTDRLRDGGDPYDMATITTTCRSCHTALHRTDDMTPGRWWWIRYIEELAGRVTTVARGDGS